MESVEVESIDGDLDVRIGTERLSRVGVHVEPRVAGS
jgi:hypothetical protein